MAQANGLQSPAVKAIRLGALAAFAWAGCGHLGYDMLGPDAGRDGPPAGCEAETAGCGDSLVCGLEVCDDGVNDGSLGSCGIDCLAGPPAGLSFLEQPSNGFVGLVMAPAVSVVVEDAAGRRVAGSTEAVTLAFGTDPTAGAATLSGAGPVAAIDGLATFPQIVVDLVATGYTMAATSGTLAPAASVPFDIRVPEPWPPEFERWGFRKRIVIPARLPTTVLTDFPVLISLVDADLAARALDTGYDVAFVTESGAPLDHEVERFDGADGTLVAWVKLPTLDTSGDTAFYMVYGDPDAVADPSVPTVWSNGFLGVWHLDEVGAAVGGEFVDSSGNGYHATGGGGAGGSVPVRVAGPIGGAQSFDGVDDSIESDPSLLDARTSLSLTMWADVRRTDNVARPGLAGQNDVVEMGFFWDDRINLWARDMVDHCDGKPTASVCTADFALNEWMHIAVSWDGAEIAMYVDGVEKDRIPLTRLRSSAFRFNIGGGGIFDPSGNALDGMVDEVRLATTDRSAEWFAIEHANQVAPSLFHTVGPEERRP